MKKYYTRACNFYYGTTSKKLIKKKLTLPLCGNANISFKEIEIITRNNGKVTSKIVDIKQIDSLTPNIKKKIKSDIKKIISKRKNFNKKINFKEPLIMGILNMTPDSFSDGGKYIKLKNAFNHINAMIDAGAKIIDIGGESTRPGSKLINSKNEWNRIKKVIKTFKKKYDNILLSVDTRKSDLMLKATSSRADIINDVSGFNHDKKSVNIIKKMNVWKVIHHMQGTPKNMQLNPKYKNVLLDIYDFFEEKISKEFKRTRHCKKIILDPGIGFGKNLKHNLMLLSKISLFHSLGFPILIGTSRKRFINHISGKFDTKERLGGTISSVMFTLSQGVQIFRVHDVIDVKQAILVYKKLLEQ